jgi:hypothetical protein
VHQPRLQCFQKSYAAVSMAFLSQKHSLRELARFLRSSERRTFRPFTKRQRNMCLHYPTMQIRPGIRILNKEQK